ncbi:MAG: zinc ribbon domain-containing protein [Acidobacteria bacterium]|nr:zinc ribbon domain-containing protein [Acidobacteriota bacterium]
MFCPKCGTTVGTDLKYCKNCGEQLFKAAEFDIDGTPGKMLDNVLTTLFLVVMFGLGILVGLVAVLLGNSIEPKFVVMIAIAYLAAVFGICYTLLSQVPKLIDARLKSGMNVHETSQPQQLRPLTTAQLEEFREPAMSVTDHTTRALEEMPLKRS